MCKVGVQDLPCSRGQLCCLRAMRSSATLKLYMLHAAVWAGLEFKVGSSATGALPPFRRGSQSSGPSAMEALKAAAQQQQQKNRRAKAVQAPGRLWAFTPAQPPPSRAETDEWLAQERSVEGSQGSNSSRAKPRTPGKAPSCNA